ncbi:MAG: hypothetical protein HOP19_11045, partial [Acidobacteria bacterium]|nr:hypothetical protein [Acidobacteriota bacterium]
EMLNPRATRVPTRSLNDAILNYLDNGLNQVMSSVRIPPRLRGPIRNAAHRALERGATELLTRGLNEIGIRGEAHEAISTSVRAALQQIQVR